MSQHAPRILIVDDDALLRRLITKVFNDIGFEVEVAADGAAAIEAFRRFRPSVVLLDIIMPGREGLETTVDMRAIDPAVPIIAMSGGGRIGPNEFLAVAEALGATATIAKPFNTGQIRDLVNSVLQSSERPPG
jgi:DNA-binding response OmpR family regulator